MKENTAKKAKKIATFKDKYYTIIEYEYRGNSYDVEFATGLNVCGCAPAWYQHKVNQERIDDLLDNKPKENNHNFEEMQKEVDSILDELGW